MKKLVLLVSVLFVVSYSFAQPYRNEWIDYNKVYYKFKVFLGVDVNGIPIKKGLVRIPQSAIAATGLASTPAQNFQLWKDGVEVPIYTSASTGALGATGFIEFWGEINNGKLDKDLYRNPNEQLSDAWSLQTDTASYFLTANVGTNKRLVTTTNAVTGTSLSPTVYYTTTYSIALRNDINPGFALQAALPLYSSSYDRGEGFVSPALRPFGSPCGNDALNVGGFDLKPYLLGPSMSLRVNAVGNANNSRTIVAKINGDSVMNFQMDYFYDAKAEQNAIPVNKIASGTLIVSIENRSMAECDEVRIAQVELDYPRTLNCDGLNALELSLPASANGHYLKFYNFNYGAVAPVLYDITNGKRYVGDITIADTVQFVTGPLTTTSNFVITKADGTNAITAAGLQQRNFVNYGNVANQGTYLIISNPLLYGSGSTNYVEQYKNYRSSTLGGSYTAKVVDIEQLTDQFAYGVKKHPLSIRNFLKYARANFAQAPKFAFLIGKAVDYMNYRYNEANADADLLNLVPTWGFPASDNLLSADDNINATPITPIGRLNVISAQEVGDYLAKVKQYDSVQNNTNFTLSDKGWMKKVLEVVGSGDLSIAAQLDNYIHKYKTILEDTAFGANATIYSKGTSSNYAQDLVDFKQQYEKGAAIVTYFGHSSATNLDFGLNNPDAYNNKFKYPVFLVNGCDAGNFYTYEPNRFNLKTSISEKFILEPQHGAIGYLATTSYGIPVYLDYFTTNFFKSISTTSYNKPIGEAIKEGIANTLSLTGTGNYSARIHSEQYAYHGDPAIKINAWAKPDYLIDVTQVQATPSFISIADDSFFVKVKVNNIGRYINDSVSFKVTRKYPNGNTLIAFTKKFKSIASSDSVFFSLPIAGITDKGIHTLTFKIDADSTISEMSETNNTVSLNVEISDNDIRPIYPYNYAIVNNSNFKLAASTANPLEISKSYVMEIDTTVLFNSSLKYTQTKTSTGGVIEFDKGITLLDSTTYYWRVSPVSATPRWNTVSFTYKNITYPGFGQQHVYQHLNNELDNIALDTASKKWNFTTKTNNLFITNSIYGTSGLEDLHFSVSVNGSPIIASACLGQSVIINVFDTLSFKPWENTVNAFGAEPTCEENRKYNFEYHYYDAAGRNSARQMLDSIPNGMYVVVRLIYDGDQVWAPEWAADSTLYGSGNTFYQRLKDQGIPIDSFYFPRTFAFVYKKNDAINFPSQSQFSAGLFDRVIMSVDCITRDTLGFITSPKYGPAKAWHNVKWNGYKIDPNAIATVDVIGINNAGVSSVLYTLDSTKHNFDISSVSAVTYPFIKLRMRNLDSLTAKPYQLTKWSVEYEASPEGAIAPNLYFNFPDSAGTKIKLNPADTLRGSVAFKNVSKANFDSLDVRVVLFDKFGVTDTFSLAKTKKLLAGDSININFALDIHLKNDGLYNAYLIINADKKQKEQYFFNNFLYKDVYIKNDKIVPVQLLDFTAKRNNTFANLNWSVTNEVDLLGYDIEHSTNAKDFNKIGNIEAKLSGISLGNYSFVHNKPINGKNYYRLKMLDKDGNFSYSPIRLVSFDKQIIVNVYPNPVQDKLSVVVSKDDNKSCVFKLLNAYGQQLTQRTFSNNVEIDMRGFAAGTYIVQVDDGTEIKSMKILKK